MKVSIYLEIGVNLRLKSFHFVTGKGILLYPNVPDNEAFSKSENATMSSTIVKREGTGGSGVSRENRGSVKCWRSLDVRVHPKRIL